MPDTPNTPAAPPASGTPAGNPSADVFANMSDADVVKAIDNTPAEWHRDGKAHPEGKIAADTPAPEPVKKAPDAEAKPPAQPEQKQDAEQPGYFQDESGKWHKPDGKFASADEVAVIEAAEKGADVVPPAETPEAKKVEGQEPPPADVAPLTPEQRAEFIKEKGYDAAAADGTPLEEFPDLTVKFVADGKERDVNLDQLVRLAKMGYYNERREQEVQQSKEMSLQTMQNISNLEAALRERDIMIERFFADPGYREASVQEYSRLNTPEVRFQRAQAELQQQQFEMQQNQRQELAVNYIASNLTPRLEAIQQQFPQVTNEEILGRMNLLYADLMQNGIVPLELLPVVEQRIEQDLRPWAEQRHTDRAGAMQKVETTARRRVEAAKVEALMAKRTMARAANGMNTGNVAPNQPPVPGKPKSADEWMESMFGKPPE